MKFPNPIALLLLVPLLALPGCLSDGLGIGKLSLDPGNIFGGEPEYLLADARELPPEVPAVLSALMMRLRGQPASEAVQLLSVSGSESVKPEESFRYQGFAVRRIVIDKLEEEEGKAGTHRLAGRLYLEDPMGRATSVAFDLAYGLRDQRLHIQEASWNPALSTEPRTALFVVPRKAVEGDLKKLGTDYQGLYDLVLENAMSINTAAALPRRAHDYLLFVFFEDRLAPKAEIDLRIGKSPDQDGGYAGASSLIVFPEGWAVGVVSGRFALSREDPYWVKVYYRAEQDGQLDVLGLNLSELDLAGPELIGLFPVPPGAEPSS